MHVVIEVAAWRS